MSLNITLFRLWLRPAATRGPQNETRGSLGEVKPLQTYNRRNGGNDGGEEATALCQTLQDESWLTKYRERRKLPYKTSN